MWGRRIFGFHAPKIASGLLSGELFFVPSSRVIGSTAVVYSLSEFLQLLTGSLDNFLILGNFHIDELKTRA